MAIVDLPTVAKVECDKCGSTLTNAAGDIVVLSLEHAADDVEGFDWTVDSDDVVWCRACLREQPSCRLCGEWQPRWPFAPCKEGRVHEATTSGAAAEDEPT